MPNYTYFGYDSQHNKAYQLHEETDILFLSYTALLQCIPAQFFLCKTNRKTNCSTTDVSTYSMSTGTNQSRLNISATAEYVISIYNKDFIQDFNVILLTKFSKYIMSHKAFIIYLFTFRIQKCFHKMNWDIPKIDV